MSHMSTWAEYNTELYLKGCIEIQLLGLITANCQSHRNSLLQFRRQEEAQEKL